MRKYLKVALLVAVLELIRPEGVIAAEGYVQAALETMRVDKGYHFTAEIRQPVGQYIKAGVTLTTYCPVMIYKGSIPSWAPFRQDYDTWVEAKVGRATVRLSDWCNHWLWQSGAIGKDTSGVRMSVRLDF